LIFERDLRTSRFTGVKVHSLLSDVLLAELMVPSSDLWLVSPWISDVDVIDNSGGVYDSVLDNPSSRAYRFSEVLGMLTRARSKLRVVTRPNASSGFLRNLGYVADNEYLRIVFDDDVHEKTFCGDDWQITGSMNYTFNGMHRNDERISYRVDAKMAAITRVEFTNRFGSLW